MYNTIKRDMIETFVNKASIDNQVIRMEGERMEVMEDMTRDEFKTIMEMVRMIIQGSKDKDEALKKIDSLTILKDSKKDDE